MTSDQEDVDLQGETECPPQQQAEEQGEKEVTIIRGDKRVEVQVEEDMLEGNQLEQSTGQKTPGLRNQSDQTTMKMAEYVLEEEEEEEILLDEDFSKTTSTKRKTIEGRIDSVKAKSSSKEPDASPALEEDSDGSDNEYIVMSPAHEDKDNSYTLEKIKRFLQETKGLRGFRVETVFPDLRMFADSVRRHMKHTGELGEEVFTEKEVQYIS